MFEFGMTPSTQQLKDWIISVERNALDDLTDFWKAGAIPVLKNELARIFATEGYGRWQALSPRYAAWKSKRYPGKTILRRTDKMLMASIREGAAGNLLQMDKDSLTWGIDLGAFRPPYPLFHERGTRRMPARPVFALAQESQAIQQGLVTALLAYLSQKIETESRRL